MEINSTQVTIRQLVPSEGHWLTEAGDIDIAKRTFSKEIYLSINDTAQRWTEITDEEYQALILEQEGIIAEYMSLNEEVGDDEVIDFINSLIED